MIGRGPSQEETKRGFQLARLSRVARSPETAVSALGLEYAVGTVGCEWCEQVAHRWGIAALAHGLVPIRFQDSVPRAGLPAGAHMPIHPSPVSVYTARPMLFPARYETAK